MDIRTLNLTLVVATSSLAFALIVMHKLHFAVKGTVYWACGSLTIACSLILLAMRDVLPDTVTVVLANTAAIYGCAVIFSGMRSFLGRDNLLKFTLTAPAVTAPLLAWYSRISPSLTGRIILVSILGGLLTGITAYELLKHDAIEDRPAQRFVGFIFAGVALLLFIRILLTLLQPSATHFFESGYATVVAYVMILALLISGTAGMIMMVCEKLHAEVKTLKGIMPICACCKKVRDDQGYWKQIESYIRDHSEIDFTHGICPDCAKELYPDLFGTEAEPIQDTKK